MKPAKPGKRYRRTEKIVLGVAMSALILSGCSDDPTADERRCVDKDGKVTQSYYCEDDETGRRSHGSGVTYWYFGGSGYSYGETVSGGTRTPPSHYVARGIGRTSGTMVASASHKSSSGIARGGFGSSASAHGSSGS